MVKVYRCIHCHFQQDVLYTQYTEEIIKVQHCEECGKVVDKYIEYDLFLVAIDLLIGRLDAYRHVIHNEAVGSLYKLCCLALFLNAYISWLSEQSVEDLDHENLLISFRSDLFIHIISSLCWCIIFFVTVLLLCYLCKFHVTICGVTKILLIVNFSRLLTFFLLTWETEFSNFFPNIPFHPVISTVITFTPCVQSLRALTNSNVIVGFLIATVTCILSMFSSILCNSF